MNSPRRRALAAAPACVRAEPANCSAGDGSGPSLKPASAGPPSGGEGVSPCSSAHPVSDAEAGDSPFVSSTSSDPPCEGSTAFCSSFLFSTALLRRLPAIASAQSVCPSMSPVPLNPFYHLRHPDIEGIDDFSCRPCTGKPIRQVIFSLSACRHIYSTHVPIESFQTGRANVLQLRL